MKVAIKEKEMFCYEIKSYLSSVDKGMKDGGHVQYPVTIGGPTVRRNSGVSVPLG